MLLMMNILVNGLYPQMAVEIGCGLGYALTLTKPRHAIVATCTKEQ